MRLIAFLFLLCTSGVLSARELSLPEIRNVLEAVAVARGESGISARFRETKVLPLLKAPVTESGTLRFLPPDRFRKETEGPRPTLTLFDGDILWIVFPQDAFAERYSLKANRMLRTSFTAFLSLLEASSAEDSFSVTGQADKDSFTLEFIPRNRRLRSTISRAVVEVSSNHQISTISLHDPGGGHSKIELFDQRKERMDPKKFRFVPPPGMRVSSPMT